MKKYFDSLNSGEITRIQEENELFNDLKCIMDIEIKESSTIIALKFEYEEAENLFFCYCEHGSKSLIRMLYECSLHDTAIKKYLMTSMNIASRILYQFTIDKIEKYLIFFDLLDLENIMLSNSMSLMISMLYFTYKEVEQVRILRDCDSEYHELNEKTSLLYFTNTETMINMKEYNYAIVINQPLKDLYSVSNSLMFIQDSLLLSLHQSQSSNQAHIKSYHKDLTKVVLTFDLESKLIDQSRHLFPFIENEITAPYMLSNFNPSKETTLLDIIINQELREKMIQSRDQSLKDGKDCSFEFNQATYSISALHDYREQIGFLLTIQTDSGRLLDNVMESRQNYGKTLRLRFTENDDLDQRVQKSLNFLYKIYGVSSRRVEEILKKKEEIMNIGSMNVSKILHF